MEPNEDKNQGRVELGIGILLLSLIQFPQKSRRFTFPHVNPI